MALLPRKRAAQITLPGVLRQRFNLEEEITHIIKELRQEDAAARRP